MRKPILLFLLLAAIVLAGCLPQTQVVVPTATATQSVKPANQAPVIPTQAALLPDSGCTVIAQKPSAGPTAETVYPAITEQDWTKGPAEARVTILEYSDFQ